MSASDRARQAVLETHKKLLHLRTKEKRKLIFGEMKQCISKVTKGGHYRMDFFLGESGCRVSCCKRAFDSNYGISHTYIGDLVSLHKKKVAHLSMHLLIDVTFYFM